jgi:serine/threonine-protein kinase
LDTTGQSLREETAARFDGELRPGDTAGSYVILGRIASGGCGTVYHARRRETGREAAVKVLHGSLAVLPKMIERFAREVRVVELLRHPNIITVHEVGALADGRPYYAMDYVDGRNVAQILEARGRFTPEEALALLTPVCAALDAAHAANVVHRDVKAGNILVSRDDPAAVKLCDFGIAKLLVPSGDSGGLTTEGRHVGTLTIMAPEQLLGGQVDARIDIYALGVLLYRMLTGRLPFDGRNALSLAQQHLEDPPPRPSLRAPLPPALDAVVLRCLEKQPERRFDSARELLAALRAAVPGASRRRDSTPFAVRRGLAVYVEVRAAEQDEADEELSEDIGAILDLAEDTLRTGGFLIASATGSDVLGVLVLSGEPEQARIEQQAGVDLAAALRRRLDAQLGPHRSVRVNVCAHAGEVVIRGVRCLEVAGGDLVRTEPWVPRAEVPQLCATPCAVAGVTGYRLTPGPAGLFLLEPRG